jgi:hypothetical protein
LRIAATTPDLPDLDGSYVDGVLAVAGAMNYPMGFIPLGMTAGLSLKDSANRNTARLVDPTCTGAPSACATNKLPFKMAPRSGGTEGSKVAVVFLALNFGGGAPGSSPQVAVSGLIKVFEEGDVAYTPPPADGMTVSFGTTKFMRLPASASVTVGKTARQVVIRGDAEPGRPTLYRFELENHARLNWNVWMAPIGSPTATRTLELPDPSLVDPTFKDPLQDVMGDDGKIAGPQARLSALQLAGTLTASGVETFSSLTLDNLGTSLAAFTTTQVSVQ